MVFVKTDEVDHIRNLIQSLYYKPEGISELFQHFKYIKYNTKKYNIENIILVPIQYRYTSYNNYV